MLTNIEVDELRDAWAKNRVGKQVIFVESIDSTSLEALRLSTSQEDGTIVVANVQTSGRGSFGRSWIAPFGKSLLMSVLLRPTLPSSAIWQLALLGSVAVVRMLHGFGVKAEIKWQNDVLCGDRKICGLLTEFRGEMERLQCVVVGIGVNVAQSQSDFASEIENLATSITIEADKNISVAEVLRSVIFEFDYYYRDYLLNGFGLVRDDWMRFNCTIGKSIVLTHRDGMTRYGVARGLDLEGALLVELPDSSTVALRSGQGVLV